MQGAAARHLARQYRPAALVVDPHLRTSPARTLRLLRAGAATSATPIVVLDVDPASDAADMVRALGVGHLLGKPLDREALDAALSLVVAG